MADVKQAVKWMQEGERVRRTSWNNRSYSIYNPPSSSSIFPTHREPLGGLYAFSVNDILADDWVLFGKDDIDERYKESMEHIFGSWADRSAEEEQQG